MRGLELSRLYYDEVVAPLLSEVMGRDASRAAVGLVGEGSECLGFDDEYSRDHDFGPSVCVWLARDDYRRWSAPLGDAFRQLPDGYRGLALYRDGAYGANRRGVWEIGAFYAKYLGLPRAPRTVGEWRRVPEDHLATAVNGAVFVDPLGTFSAIRGQLLDFYPEDVRLHKLAARCVTMARAGQYNYPRCLARGETIAARLALARFTEAAISAAHLLNKRYTPFYKWMRRSLGALPILGQELSESLERLWAEESPSLTEKICGAVVGELQAQGLSDARGDFLLEHAEALQNLVQDQELRELGPWVE
ncbi:MAG: DUF4037 domain-containing protein [Peptococcaceae bacterium]|nr:DUF4037 domain-containing protein [Peptococcaceae bacterium]